MKIMVCIQTKIKLCSKKYTFCTIVFYIHVNVINKINEINYMKHFCYKRYNCNIIQKKFKSKLKAAKLSLIFIYVSHYVMLAAQRLWVRFPGNTCTDNNNVYAECTVSCFGYKRLLNA